MIAKLYRFLFLVKYIKKRTSKYYLITTSNIYMSSDTTIPTSVAMGERSFSKLKLRVIKSSTTEENHLNH